MSKKEIGEITGALIALFFILWVVSYALGFI